MDIQFLLKLFVMLVTLKPTGKNVASVYVYEEEYSQLRPFSRIKFDRTSNNVEGQPRFVTDVVYYF
jgi:hypothetical protein